MTIMPLSASHNKRLSNLTECLTAAAYKSFNRIREVAAMCIPHLTRSSGPHKSVPKRHFDRGSGVLQRSLGSNLSL